VFLYFAEDKIKRYSGSKNRLIQLFVNKDGSQFSNFFIEKIRIEIANNKMSFHKLILNKIKYALK
jgi:hypothetical protein